MFLYLVHHGQALPADSDAQRPLSPAGKASVETVATEAATRGTKPAAIWHSGKLRAKQTAEPYWRLCNPLAEFSAARNLQPDDPPEWIRDVVAAEERDIMLVGHMPHLERLRALLLSARGTAAASVFPRHGIVALERVDARWLERWRIAP